MLALGAVARPPSTRSVNVQKDCLPAMPGPLLRRGRADAGTWSHTRQWRFELPTYPRERESCATFDWAVIRSADSAVSNGSASLPNVIRRGTNAYTFVPARVAIVTSDGLPMVRSVRLLTIGTERRSVGRPGRLGKKIRPEALQPPACSRGRYSLRSTTVILDRNKACGSITASV